jgi:bifunctional non-homologous end joining protein LigD
MKPMLLHHAPEQFVLTDDWMLELKYDGIRAIVDTRDGEQTISTRRGVEISFQFPEIHAPKGLLLDGEIVGFDGEFHKLNWVQRRMGIVDSFKVMDRMEQYPIQYVVFDVLNDLSLTYSERLRDLVGLQLSPCSFHGDPTGGHVQPSPVWYAKEIGKLWSYVRTNNLEGLVAKRLTSRYIPGTRSHDWLKIKHTKPAYKERE